MSAYENVDLLDMELDEEQELYTYPCPCGDRFFITLDDLLDNEDKAKCPSCSLILKVQYDPDELEAQIQLQESPVTFEGDRNGEKVPADQDTLPQDSVQNS